MRSGTEKVLAELQALQRGFAAELAVRVDPEPFMQQLLGVLFPHFRGGAPLEETNLADLRAMLVRIGGALRIPSVDATITAFLPELPAIYRKLLLDAQAIFEGDPAARSVDEVIISYPGFFAMAIFRAAHQFFSQGVPILPRLLTEFAHQRTGIDIHPGASIGEGFCIDHGTGIVIGETSVVGRNVKLYQGVTLGALSVVKSAAGTKRHPTVEDNVVLYSNATVLGGDTIIGTNSIIGGNVWLTESVPPNSIIYHKAEVTTRRQD